MKAREAILEQWIAETLASYPSATVAFIAGEKDPFRNPVGETVRRSLAVLLDQLYGAMEPADIARALDDIVRLRAVQDLAPSDAVGFVFLLKPILRRFAPGEDLLSLNQRIDALALLAFEKYMHCREQVAEIRVKEGRRAAGLRRATG